MFLKADSIKLIFLTFLLQKLIGKLRLFFAVAFRSLYYLHDMNKKDIDKSAPT